MAQAFENVMGRKATPSELQYAQAVAWLETNYGNGWKGAMVGSNNWGAVQCALKNVGQPGCLPYQDSQSDGTTYKIGFKSYPSAVAGAEDVVRHVFKNRPRTAAALASTTPSAFRASYAMRREKYYGGFCPNATKQFGGEAARASFANPDRDAGTRACMQEAVAAHARLTTSLSQEIAAANTDPAGLDPGSFDDADSWWLGRVTDVARDVDTAFPAGKYLAIVAGTTLGYYVISQYVGKRRA
jgi:hypothetical protein